MTFSRAHRCFAVAIAFALSGCTSAATTDSGADVVDRPCSGSSDCASGEICVFATQGCSNQGVCRTDYQCGRPSSPYCGCNGVSFFDHCAGPASRWVSEGQCPDPNVDASHDAATDASAE